MNFLELFLHRNGLNPVASMNFLQASGLISDNCENAADVATEDHGPAVAALAAKFRLPLPAALELF